MENQTGKTQLFTELILPYWQDADTCNAIIDYVWQQKGIPTYGLIDKEDVNNALSSDGIPDQYPTEETLPLGIHMGKVAMTIPRILIHEIAHMVPFMRQESGNENPCVPIAGMLGEYIAEFTVYSWVNATPEEAHNLALQYMRRHGNEYVYHDYSMHDIHATLNCSIHIACELRKLMNDRNLCRLRDSHTPMDYIHWTKKNLKDQHDLIL